MCVWVLEIAKFYFWANMGVKKIAGALGNRVLGAPCGIPMLTDTTKHFIITKVVKHLMVGDQTILATASALMYLTIQSVIMMVGIVVDLM